MIALLIFINGHLSFNNANQVVVTAAYPGGASYLYPKSLERRFESESKGSQIANVQGLYRQFRQVNETVLEELSILLNNEDINITENSSSLSGALSKTLCYTNRICQDDSRMKSRVLILSVDGNLSSQYIPIMNSIFASQKMVGLLWC